MNSPEAKITHHHHYHLFLRKKRFAFPLYKEKKQNAIMMRYTLLMPESCERISRSNCLENGKQLSGEKKTPTTTTTIEY
ncbi:hypothetical protein DERP_005042 [Dermatophagoides pteronyssinus]|uniref:Uncharacterized protein n=1 Tax=Dermatophagoides pteronyssinus TaxID=6956 RepID=A0ABQ8JTU2_DERPT|nr:hypothetical protein DERP_005042 [Dermatophagoides pteronyssinus]